MAVYFLNRDAVLAALRQAVAEVRVRFPEITRVLLFGSLARGDYHGDSDADLIVVISREDIRALERGAYHIHTAAIPVDTLVYSQSEFDRLAAEPGSLVAEALSYGFEL